MPDIFNEPSAVVIISKCWVKRIYSDDRSAAVLRGFPMQLIRLRTFVTLPVESIGVVLFLRELDDAAPVFDPAISFQGGQLSQVKFGGTI